MPSDFISINNTEAEEDHSRELDQYLQGDIDSQHYGSNSVKAPKPSSSYKICQSFIGTLNLY